jgi:glyoxylate reductase
VVKNRSRLVGKGVRRGWDSNPRDPNGPTGFRDRLLQPLGHLSQPCIIGGDRLTFQAMSHDIVIADELRELLGEQPLRGHDVHWLTAEEPTPSGNYAAVIPLLSRPMGESEFERLPRLQIVANCAVGFDNIDLDAAERRGIVVTNTPDVLTAATADLTWALILAVARRLKEGQQLIATGKWRGWHPMQLLGLELNRAVLGIVGAGRIGQAVGSRAKGFGMQVLYCDQSRKPEFEAVTEGRMVELTALLRDSDVVTLHVPSTSETRKMFGASLLQCMKRGAIFINTARGDLVDEPALMDALESGHLGGVGLDVFEQEPAVSPGLTTHARAVTLPHIGSATTATRQAMAQLAVSNVEAVLTGTSPITPVART